MLAYKRKELINICKERNIPYVGVKKNKYFFEMQECENCPVYIQDLHNATQNIIGENVISESQLIEHKESVWSSFFLLRF